MTTLDAVSFEAVEGWEQLPEGFIHKDVAGMRSMVHGPIAEDRPGRVSVLTMDGSLVTRWGGPDPCAPGSFCAPHGIAVDSRGAVYVAEVTYSSAGSKGLVPPDCHTFQKFVPVPRRGPK